MLRRLPLLLLACLALGLAACGDDSADTDAPAGAGSTQVNPSQDSQADVDNDDNESSTAGGEVVVGMENIEFVPDSISAQVGQTVLFRNDEAVPHNVVSQEGPLEFESDTFGKDGTYELKLTKPGEIKYVCTLHPGMDGTIQVEGS